MGAFQMMGRSAADGCKWIGKPTGRSIGNLFVRVAREINLPIDLLLEGAADLPIGLQPIAKLSQLHA